MVGVLVHVGGWLCYFDRCWQKRSIDHVLTLSKYGKSCSQPVEGSLTSCTTPELTRTNNRIAICISIGSISSRMLLGLLPAETVAMNFPPELLSEHVVNQSSRGAAPGQPVAHAIFYTYTSVTQHRVTGHSPADTGHIVGQAVAAAVRTGTRSAAAAVWEVTVYRTAAGTILAEGVAGTAKMPRVSTVCSHRRTALVTTGASTDSGAGAEEEAANKTAVEAAHTAAAEAAFDYMKAVAAVNMMEPVGEGAETAERAEGAAGEEVDWSQG